MAAFFRYILFCIFFTAGAGAIVLSILVLEVGDHYNNRENLRLMRVDNARLETLINEYSIQIKEAKENPEALARLKRVTLGIEPEAEETAFPRADIRELAAAEAAIEASKVEADNTIKAPKWVTRSSEERFRRSLFFAGTGLVLITFLFFGTKQKAAVA